MKSLLNIAYRDISKNINILYSPSYRLFDSIINNLDNINLYTENDIVKSYYYDAYFSNNFLTHLNQTINFCKAQHLPDVLALHSGPPNNFKKEDVMLTHNNTKNSHKIVFGSDIASSWGFEPSSKTHVIEYGIPEVEWSIDQKSKNVLLLNLENNPQIDMLHSNMSAVIPDTDILKNITTSTPISNLGYYLAQYKTVIDFGNKINVLFCASLGIKCITPLKITNDLIFNIENFANIIPQTKEILDLDMPRDKIYNTSKQILLDYSYDVFSNRIGNIFSQIKHKEIFVI